MGRQSTLRVHTRTYIHTYKYMQTRMGILVAAYAVSSQLAEQATNNCERVFSQQILFLHFAQSNITNKTV